jgi:choice-of-anchor B domain-containing protein
MPNRLFLCAAIVAVLTAAGNAYAHSDGVQPLFVAQGGVDAGDCQDITAPCATIGYALGRVGKNGQIRVADGAYSVDDAEDLFQLISGDVDVQGGYERKTGFAMPSAAASTIAGVPARYAGVLSERGFHVVVDRKGIDIAAIEQTEKLLAIHESLKSSLPATACVGGDAAGLPCNEVDLLSHLGFNDISARPGNAADVWGFVDLNSNREYAIVGFDIGTGVFDVTDAENPREVGFIDGQRTSWRDIKVYQFWNVTTGRWNAHAYITTDGSSDGLFVIDMSGLPHSVRQLTYDGDFSAAHNVYATNTDFGTGLSMNGALPTLIIAGSNRNSGPYRAYSLGNPDSPAFEVMPGSGRSDYMHDAASMVITDSRKDTQCVNATTYCEVLFDFNESTFDIWDITDTGNPVRLSRTNYANVEYVHSGWMSEDKQYLYVHDELDERNRGLNTTLRVYSLANLRSPVPETPWTGPTAAIDHNGFVRGNRYYMSNYSRGLTVLDISNPAVPVAVGRLDTYPASDNNSFIGAWGAYPFFHSGSIAISDIGSGLYMARDETLHVPQGSLSFSTASYGGVEGSQLQVAVKRVGGATGVVGVDYEIVSATGDSSDLLASSAALSWNAGDASDKFITLDLLGDATVEDLERLLIRLVAPTGGATLAPGNVANVYIADAGAASTVGFDRTTINIAERGFATAVAVLTRTGSAAGAISVDYSMSGGNADAGVDFQGATSGTLNWADGDANPKWLEFVINDDGSGEADEYVELTLGNAVGTNVGQATLRINIADGTGINNSPNAVAGASQTVKSGVVVTLDGAQSNDPDGDAITYQWLQTSGTTVTLNNANTATASFAAPDVASDTLLRFQLTVSDTRGLTNVSTTSVTVRKPGKSGGGSLSWLVLALLAATLLKRMLFDDRLLAVRTRRDNVHRHAG